MNITILTFFSNKGGIGKTSLVYHLAWMFASLRKRVLLADLDPQANLTAALLTDTQIEDLWISKTQGATIYRAVEPLTSDGDIVEPQLQEITDDLYLIPGDVALSSYEDSLSTEWPNSMGNTNLYRPMRILSSFWQVMEMGAKKIEADLIMVDVGPNLGAINRSVLIATDYVAIPLGTDLFSIQALETLGPTLRSWKNLWNKRLSNWASSPEKEYYSHFQLPTGKMQAIGYIRRQPIIRLDRPITVYDKWFNRIPDFYRECVLNEKTSNIPKADPECLATIRHYIGLIQMGQERRKPIFNLKPADGALGCFAFAVQSAQKDFHQLAGNIAKKIGMDLPHA